MPELPEGAELARPAANPAPAPDASASPLPPASEGLLTRNREKIGICLVSKTTGRLAITSHAQLGRLLDLSNYKVKSIILNSLRTLDAQSLLLLSRIAAKKFLLHQNRDGERTELLKRAGLDAQSIEIAFRGKTVKVDVPEKMFTALGIINEVFIQNQYDVTEANTRGKIVVDAGANIGLFSIYAILCGAKKVYAFEPLSETYSILEANIKQNGMQSSIVPVKKGVGDSNFKAQIRNFGAGDVSASISRDLNFEHSEEIEVVKLDDYLAGAEANFIKMDIEGYEEKALLGAAETLRKFKPVLSFSAYHKPDDKEVLPKIVLGIRPDYRIKLICFAEEDFYCD